MKKHIITLLIVSVFAGTSAQSYTDTFRINNNKHSLGLNIGWLDGLSLKFNMWNNLFIQTDIGVSCQANPFCFIHESFGGPFLYTDLGVQLNVFYEKLFPNSCNAYWLAGGGIHIGKECTESIKSPYFKTGAKIMLGIEWKFNIPLSLQLDTRQGYGVIFAIDNKSFESKHLFLSTKHPIHFFDYSFVFSIRYHFGKKN